MSKRRGNGEGSIFKRKDGLWAATITLEHGRRKTFYGRTRPDVARKLGAALKANQDGLPIIGERLTVGGYLADWLEAVRPTIRPQTYRRYEQYIRLDALPFIDTISLARLSPDHLQRLYANRLAVGQSPTSVGHLH